MKALSQALMVLAFSASSLSADTITGQDDRTVNGSLKEMIKNEVTFVARFESGDRTYVINRAVIKVIEFNGITFNPGAPSRSPGLSSRSSDKAQSGPSEPSDTIVMRGTRLFPCKLIGIDEQLIHCMGVDQPFRRKIVMRILLEMAK